MCRAKLGQGLSWLRNTKLSELANKQQQTFANVRLVQKVKDFAVCWITSPSARNAVGISLFDRPRRNTVFSVFLRSVHRFICRLEQHFGLGIL